MAIKILELWATKLFDRDRRGELRNHARIVDLCINDDLFQRAFNPFRYGLSDQRIGMGGA